MATRARVGVQNSDGSITSIYSHWDGYPDGIGVALLKAWTTEEQVRELVALGDLSILGTEIGEQHDFDKHGGLYGHHEQNDWCLAFGRDRGEEDVAARTHPAEAWPDYGQEYEYLFDGGEWLVRDTYGQHGWRPLALILAPA